MSEISYEGPTRFSPSLRRFCRPYPAVSSPKPDWSTRPTRASHMSCCTPVAGLRSVAHTLCVCSLCVCFFVLVAFLRQKCHHNKCTPIDSGWRPKCIWVPIREKWGNIYCNHIFVLGMRQNPKISLKSSLHGVSNQ